LVNNVLQRATSTEIKHKTPTTSNKWVTEISHWNSASCCSNNADWIPDNVNRLAGHYNLWR